MASRFDGFKSSGAIVGIHVGRLGDFLDAEHKRMHIVHIIHDGLDRLGPSYQSTPRMAHGRSYWAVWYCGNCSRNCQDTHKLRVYAVS